MVKYIVYSALPKFVDSSDDLIYKISDDIIYKIYDIISINIFVLFMKVY